MKPSRISIIIPCLNEASYILDTLKPLQALRRRGHEIILVDAQSADNTVELSRQLVDLVITSAPGRARQMNHGAQYATGDVLCFIHADTVCPDHIDQLISNTLCQSKKTWGRFDVQLSGSFWIFRIIEWMMNKRSCLTAIATGDQGIFICRNIFHKISGFADISLMEDIEICKRLRKISRPICVNKGHLITSSRRWEQQGILRTMFLMWSLRLGYFMGLPTNTLASKYRTHVSEK